MIELVDSPIDIERARKEVETDQAGAVVVFVGTTREFTDGRRTVYLSYEAYPEMARAKLAELEATASQKWPLLKCAIIHRLGEVGLGEASVVVAVSSAHRGPAFESAQWIMDTLKHEVPIWKEEHWADGSREWVHPGLDSARPTDTSSQGKPDHGA